ncbi:hypothetical protein D7V97_05595 [Corallococcus sp. CA053C]|uniref:hypothetical protein n=1 Tax=Corallococcus sp. CA053C TaxID=2316732 RepID=UPI000EA3402F|nr:hypothetical protein [Corallococcus sp. CA053C]RKH13456.1 hypothetical protein D7V97_05595 [Corallococcus sp. CA053C]
MSSKPGVLEPLRVRVRRFQFIVGLGFLSLVLGAMLSVSLVIRLQERVSALPFDLVRLGVAVVLENLWILAVLPVLCYGASRIVALRPWNTALGAAATGGLFVLALNFVRDGTEGLLEWNLGTVLRLVAFAGGILLSARAIRAGRAAAERGSTAAQVKAEARKSEYDEFLKAAEADGARLEQREGASAQAPAAVAPEATAQAATPDATPEGTSSPPGEVPKTPAA